MASSGPGGSRMSSNNGEFPDFEQFREKMNRDRDAFFNDQAFFKGREPPSFSSFRVSHKEALTPTRINFE